MTPAWGATKDNKNKTQKSFATYSWVDAKGNKIKSDWKVKGKWIWKNKNYYYKSSIKYSKKYLNGEILYKKKLVEGNLRLVVKIARGYLGRGLGFGGEERLTGASTVGSGGPGGGGGEGG